jgi:hypothetical protein
MNKDIVIFRKDKDGAKDCFALFPELPSDIHGHFATAFQHIGQHCSADYHGCIANSVPATPDEYADLHDELVGRGYEMKIRRRATPSMHALRRKLAAEWR